MAESKLATISVESTTQLDTSPCILAKPKINPPINCLASFMESTLDSSCSNPIPNGATNKIINTIANMKFLIIIMFSNKKSIIWLVREFFFLFKCIELFLLREDMNHLFLFYMILLKISFMVHNKRVD
eukprot:gb/GECH01011345.1/.p1 GENE.gb/GECH01011345.1/~~gb/GECH01011345.1/.p1  ORF type:complete len:128 (+),score=16.73 gb/GECH01011345.1/:1-384(+)